LDSPVRGLSAQEVDDLLNGRGAGYARTAELNNYPGPRHVLDLKKELDLSSDQEKQIQAIYEQMHAEAEQIGQEIVQREAQFSAAFAGGIISEAGLQAQTEQLALLYGQLRAAHLQAHLQITPLLSAEQIAAYNTLRGYTSAGGQPTSAGHQHQSH
jgi:Spy/CpxP family protein refolding chaperone